MKKVYISFLLSGLISFLPIQTAAGANSEEVTITKTVRNVTRGSEFSSQTQAQTGDVIEFRIEVKPGSEVQLVDVTVTDSFPRADFVYQEGSLMVNNSPSPPGLSSGGLSFSSVPAPLVITYKASVGATVGTFTDQAMVQAQNAQTQVSTTSVVVSFNKTTTSSGTTTTTPSSINNTATPSTTTQFFVSPPTGANTNSIWAGFIFAGILTAAFGISRYYWQNRAKQSQA